MMDEPVYREEPQSGVVFGPFRGDEYYDIENSEDVRISKGDSLKTVECVVMRGKKLLFIEAKKTAPKELSAERKKERLAEMIKAKHMEEYEALIKSIRVVPSYLSDICEKFILSLCLVLSIAEGRIQSKDMLPEMRGKIQASYGNNPVFVLVITWSKRDWLSPIQDALNIALKKFEKTNHIQVVVLTAEQAASKGLVSTFTPMPEI